MKYILYGAGICGKNMLAILGRENVSFFIDSQHADSEVDGLRVYSPMSVVKYRRGEQIVICTKKIKVAIEMTNLLQSMGLEYKLMDDVADEIVTLEAQKYNSICKRDSLMAREEYYWRCPWDRVENNGSTDAYFWQDLWAAKKIFKEHPDIHYDIGSRIDGLIAHLLSYGQKVNVIDIRAMKSSVDGLNFVQADATKLECFSDDEIYSLSAICSVEHFGLGRYTDKIDPEACFTFMNNVHKKMKKNGSVYISVPIGKERCQFNAHRIFSPTTVISEMIGMKIEEFSVYDKRRIITNADLYGWDNVSEYGAIGLFHFRKH